MSRDANGEAWKIGYSIEEAAAAVGYSTDTIRKALRNSELSPKYANTKPTIAAKELQAWYDALPSEPRK